MTQDEQALRIAREIDPYQGAHFPTGECFFFTVDEAIEFARRLHAEWSAGQEPVAFVAEVYQSRYTIELNGHDLAEGMPLYAAPVAKPAAQEEVKSCQEELRLCQQDAINIQAELADVTLKHQVACDTIARMNRDDAAIATEFRARELLDEGRCKAIGALQAELAELREWIIHNGGLLNEWAGEWNPRTDGTLTSYIGKRLDAARGKS